MSTATEEKTPQYVHCKECKREKVAFYAPILVKDAVQIIKALEICDGCGAKNSSTMGRYVAPDAEFRDYRDWLENGDVGLSSQTILYAITGNKRNYTDNLGYLPQDPSDFRRCYLLLKAFPELRPQLYKVAEMYPQWKQLVEHWDQLEALLTSEVGDIAAWTEGSADKTYRRMQELRGEQ